jgi:hypothetical protein
MIDIINDRYYRINHESNVIGKVSTRSGSAKQQQQNPLIDIETVASLAPARSFIEVWMRLWLTIPNDLSKSTGVNIS